MFCGYKPARKASATITAIKPSTIPIATNVSCISTESTFFIIFQFNVNNKSASERKLEKALRQIGFSEEGIQYKFTKKSDLYKFYLINRKKSNYFTG
jgi:hypothetical protein